MKTFNKKTGFTLVEIMVAVSIFAIVAVIATGALVTASDINRKAQSIKLAVDNVNFALNKMAFEIRVGGSYSCGKDGVVVSVAYGDNGNDCPDGGNTLYFYTYRGDDCDDYYTSCATTENKIPVVYKLNQAGNGLAYSNNGGSSYFDITSSEVRITNLEFKVNGAENSILEPRVQVTLAGVVAEGTKYETEFDLRTTVVTRGN